MWSKQQQQRQPRQQQQLGLQQKAARDQQKGLLPVCVAA
jgi:hypothetical protein